jgi:hypothetical protein
MFLAVGMDLFTLIESLAKNGKENPEDKICGI